MNTVLDLFPQILSGNDLLLAVCRENNVPVMKLFLDRGAAGEYTGAVY